MKQVPKWETVMKYKCADDIFQVLHDRMDALPVGVDGRDWYAQDQLTQEAIGFLRLYREALDNPPEGVVGVGCITYAEGVLRAAQMEKQNASVA